MITDVSEQHTAVRGSPHGVTTQKTGPWETGILHEMLYVFFEVNNLIFKQYLNYINFELLKVNINLINFILRLAEERERERSL
jgi:hypothetical protein